MVNFGAAGESLARFCTTTLLESLEELDLCARSSPQSPRGNAGGVPLDVSISDRDTRDRYASEAIDRLTANTAAAWPQFERGFAIRSWRKVKGRTKLSAARNGPGPA
jgi:hypothetical protein